MSRRRPVHPTCIFGCHGAGMLDLDCSTSGRVAMPPIASWSATECCAGRAGHGIRARLGVSERPRCFVSSPDPWSADGRTYSADDGPMPNEPSTGAQPGLPGAVGSEQTRAASAPETYVWPLVA